jgi:hypothetical protein
MHFLVRERGVFFYCLKRISGKEEGTSTPVFSEIISIGGKNWQIGGKKYIDEGSGGRLRPCHGFQSKYGSSNELLMHFLVRKRGHQIV